MDINYLGGVQMRHVARRDGETGLLITEISEADLSRLGEYSCTLPTNPRVGRVWKCNRGGRWFLGYCYAHEGNDALIGWRLLVVVDAQAEAKL